MKIIAYFKDTYNELMHKVTWPTWDELQESALLVMVASVIIAIVIAAMDIVFKLGMTEIYNMIFGNA